MPPSEAAGASASGGRAGEPSVDSGGAAGAAGEGGSAGASEGGASGAAGERGDPNGGRCDPLSEHDCDDSNDCTTDSCEPLLGCQHTPRETGGPCDDHNLCTNADSCTDAAQCIGQPQTRTAALLGELRSFGSYDEESSRLVPFQGLSLALSEHSLVFAEQHESGLTLNLVTADQGKLSLADRSFSYGRLSSADTGLWSDAPDVLLLALSDTRFALVSSKFAIEVYDVDADRLVFLDYLYLPTDTALTRGVGRGGRLWLASSGTLYGYDIAASDGAVTPLATVKFPGAIDAVALSEDMHTLYVGSQRGVTVVDVSDPLAPVVGSAPVITEQREHRPYKLEARGGYLLLQDEILYGSAGDFRIFRSSDFGLVASFEATSLLEADYSAPTGGTLLGDQLLLQRIRFVDSKPAGLSAELYSLGDAGATLEDSWTYRDLARMGNRRDWQPPPPVSAGRVAILGPTRRVVFAEHNELSEWRGIAQGELDRVLPGAPGHALILGSESSHALDLTDPTQPRFESGGLLEPGATSLRKVSLPTDHSAWPTSLNVNESFSGNPGADVEFTQFTSDGSHPLAPSSSFRAPLGNQQVVSNGLLFTLDAGADEALTLRTFALPRTKANPSRTLTALSSVVLPGVAASSARSFQIAVDAQAHHLAVYLSGDAPSLQWFSRTGREWAFAGSVPLPNGSDPSLLVRGRRALVVTPILGIGGEGSQIDLVGLDDAGHLTVQASRHLLSEEAYAQRAPGFDGEQAYVSSLVADPTYGVPAPQVQALALNDLHTLATYAVSRLPSSMATVNSVLVFGARDAVFTVTPACGTSP